MNILDESGKSIDIPYQAYCDIRYPVLSTAEVYYSTGVIIADGVVESSKNSVLRFNYDYYNDDYESVDSMPVFEIVVKNNAFCSSRSIYNGNWNDRKVFLTSNDERCK